MPDRYRRNTEPARQQKNTWASIKSHTNERIHKYTQEGPPNYSCSPEKCSLLSPIKD